MAMAGRRDQAEERARAQANLDQEFGRSVQNDARAASQFDRTLAIQQQQANRREAVQLHRSRMRTATSSDVQPVRHGRTAACWRDRKALALRRASAGLCRRRCPPAPQAPTTPDAWAGPLRCRHCPRPAGQRFRRTDHQGMRTLSIRQSVLATASCPTTGACTRLTPPARSPRRAGQTVNVNNGERVGDAARGKQDADRFGEIRRGVWHRRKSRRSPDGAPDARPLIFQAQAPDRASTEALCRRSWPRGKRRGIP